MSLNPFANQNKNMSVIYDSILLLLEAEQKQNS